MSSGSLLAVAVQISERFLEKGIYILLKMILISMYTCFCTNGDIDIDFFNRM